MNVDASMKLSVPAPDTGDFPRQNSEFSQKLTRIPVWAIMSGSRIFRLSRNYVDVIYLSHFKANLDP
jgi:hypothetical protein